MNNNKLTFLYFLFLGLVLSSCLDDLEKQKIEKSIIGKWEITAEREFSNDKLTSSIVRSNYFFEFKNEVSS